MKIETKRLTLREPRIRDWKDLVDGLNNLNISKNTLTIPYPYTKKDALEYLNRCSKKKKDKKSYKFFIELRKEKKVIGAIDLNDYKKDQGTAETGSWINERYQKKGYITEAKIAVNDFVFHKLKLRKLKSKVFKENKASQKTQERMGYQKEGVLRKESICKPTKKIHDDIVYGLLKEEWEKARPKVIKHLNKKIKKLENRK